MSGPLAKPTAETSMTVHDFTPPTWLKHQPIFMLPYAPFDAPDPNKNADGNAAATDAKYLSIGLAQWNEKGGPHDLSAKVWRYPLDTKKWSRQSEELPLHRLADLCTLLVKTFFQKHSTSAVAPTAVVPAGTFEGQHENLELRRMAEVPDDFGKQSARVKERLRRLRDELNQADLGDQE